MIIAWNLMCRSANDFGIMMELLLSRSVQYTKRGCFGSAAHHVRTHYVGVSVCPSVLRAYHLTLDRGKPTAGPTKTVRGKLRKQKGTSANSK
jgi:hypothetical protein